MDFGGEGGTLLGTLRRVIVRMISEFRPIVGFGFVFEDQILSFGESGETELSVVIDGPGGERITNACVVADDYYFTLNIRGFKVRFWSSTFTTAVLTFFRSRRTTAGT